ncbi:MAG TPA: MBL fold metallo-hydrolase [Microbacteriaceae bacterium]|nr:MBL fold metallo-hydrolase [Microbacteriaceae bacterium]
MAENAHHSLRFLGATETVTGSRYLVSAGQTRILVDCGLFQGYKLLRDRNRLPFPVDPASIDAVVLTHAHLDHSGYLPALVRDGFSGPIYSTSGTAELSALVLLDSGHLLEEEVRFAQKRGSSRHTHPQPVYTVKDAERSLESFRVTRFDEEFEIDGQLRATLVPAGHILGASQVRLNVGGTTVHFTGDLGRVRDPLMRAPRRLGAVDVLVTESTYGNRTHPKADPEQALGEIVSRVAKRGGVVMIPSFAVGRAETLLLHLSRLRKKGAIPDIPVYLNSPMAVDASLIYRSHQGEHRISASEFEAMYSLATLVHTVDESKLLNLRGGPMVVISASGMLEGGRILHHIEAYGSDPRNAIVLSGFQAGGTRGAALARGERSLRIFGRDVPITAEVIQMESLSAHADSDELIEWMRAADRAPAMTYITHGEPDAANDLRIRLKRSLGWEARVPEFLETVDLAHPR